MLIVFSVFVISFLSCKSPFIFLYYLWKYKKTILTKERNKLLKPFADRIQTFSLFNIILVTIVSYPILAKMDTFYVKTDHLGKNNR